jgi:hypothetical protein
MTITAKFPGKCRNCGAVINVGDRIEWEKGSGAAHVKCPEKQKIEPENSIKIKGGSGYGCNGWTIGQVIVNPYHGNDHYRVDPEKRIPEFLTVVSASKHYVREDGMSFGVGDESGYTYGAVCRPATDEESAPLRARIEEKITQQNRKKQLRDLADLIRKTGEFPAGDNTPEGDRLHDTQDIYGGGSWFVVGGKWIWYCQNNGMDGDNWANNNVRTGGAGAIGYRVPYTPELNKLIRG